jgi:beta-lactamase class A
MNRLTGSGTAIFIFVCAYLSLAVPRIAHAADPVTFAPDLTARIATIETKMGGHIGVDAFSVDGGKSILYRPDERFLMCSTFKFLLAANVLKNSNLPQHELTHAIAYGPSAIIGHSPVTQAHLAAGSMTIGDLAAAAVEESDNGAANLLLETVGGPAGLTRFLRSIGDQTSHLDRNEPSLNSAKPGDQRDTATPASFARDVNVLLLGTGLPKEAQRTLISWVTAATTGMHRIRAGLPAGWKAGDKTGTGGHGSINDVAIVWPPGRPPMIISIFCSGSNRPTSEIEAAIAQIGRLTAENL